MPLGILADDEFSRLTQSINIELDDKIYLYSDGVTEGKNSNGELFGDERLKSILVNSKEDRFDKTIKTLKHFTGNEDQNDDITFVELNCNIVESADSQHDFDINIKALPWTTSVSLTPEDMRSSDIVRKLSTLVSSMPFLSRHNGVLHVLLSEIYSNALEHSILNIESSKKDDEQGFEEYYKNRDLALSDINDGLMVFKFDFLVENGGHFLNIEVTDSGRGYNGDDLQSDDEMLHGRGLSIISSFTEKTFFSNEGKTLNVLYKL